MILLYQTSIPSFICFMDLSCNGRRFLLSGNFIWHACYEFETLKALNILQCFHSILALNAILNVQVKMIFHAVLGNLYANHFLSPKLCFSRSSGPQMYCKLGVLKNFSKFTGKHMCHCLFFKFVLETTSRFHIRS